MNSQYQDTDGANANSAGVDASADAPLDQTASKNPKDKETKLRIVYNGIERKLDVHESDPVSTVLAAAIALFPVTEAQHLLALFNSDGVEITNEVQTVEEAGLKNNSRLVLRQSTVKGG